MPPSMRNVVYIGSAMHSLFNESNLLLLHTARYCVKQLSNVLEAACRGAGIPTQCSGLKIMIG